MTKIIMIDDHKIFLDALISSINEQEGLEVTGGFSSAESALEYLKDENLSIDVAIVDIALPGMNGVELTKEILDRYPLCRIVALSMYDDDAIVRGMLKAGARGYVLKESDYRDLIVAIRAVASGAFYFSPRIGETLRDDYILSKEKNTQQNKDLLTQREKEVLSLLLKGKTITDIENELGIGKRTIYSHRDNIMKKLQCDSLAELMRFCIREGIGE